jgi:hypothetical protein
VQHLEGLEGRIGDGTDALVISVMVAVAIMAQGVLVLLVHRLAM